MGNYNITGWSAGGRRPITNNLRAGQFRQMGVPRNVSSNIFINNNFGCMGGGYNASYFDNCCGNNDNGLSKFEKWMLGLGLGSGILGSILDLFKKSKPEGTGNAEEPKIEPQVVQQQEKPAEAPVEKPPEPVAETPVKLPNLFDAEGMQGLTTVDAVLDKFKTSTGADAVKISDLKDGTITLSNVVDNVNGTNKKGKVTINVADLKGLAENQSKTIGNYAGKPITAENLDGYIRVKIGSQTYIVGKDASGNCTGYHFKNGNVDGAGDYNWRNKR